MDIFVKILSFLKLPIRIICLLCFTVGALLFFPENIKEKLKLVEFIGENGKYIGIVFIFSLSYILLTLGFYIWGKIIPSEYEKKKYMDILSKISDYLLLNIWEVFIYNAPNGIIMKDFILNKDDFNNYLNSLIWPRHYKNIKKMLLEINEVYNKFVTIYSLHAEIINDDHFLAVKYYKTNGWNKNYEREACEYKQWSLTWYYALHYLVILLNYLIEIVNKTFEDNNVPKLFKNKYVIENTLGLYNEEYLKKLKLNHKLKNTNGA